MMVYEPISHSPLQMTLDSTVKNPLRHVLRAYDRAIRACELADPSAARRAISLLRGSLDTESPEAHGFDGIFLWCERAIASGDFSGPGRRLSTLRNAWQTAEQVRSGGAARPARVLTLMSPAT